MNGDQMVHMQINSEVCIGAGHCEMLEEATFLVDDDTAIAGVIGDGMLPLERAQKIVETCPSRAITIAQS